MTVGQIVGQVLVGQSTVSAHLRVLAEARFVLIEKRGTANLYRVNQWCVSCFPSAADVVMGKPRHHRRSAPWRDRARPRFRRRPGRARVRPPRRPHRTRDRPRRDRGNADARPPPCRRAGRGQRGFPPRPDRGHPAARRLSRRGDLQLRDRPVHRQAPRGRRLSPQPRHRRGGVARRVSASTSSTASPTRRCGLSLHTPTSSGGPARPVVASDQIRHQANDPRAAAGGMRCQMR